MTGGKLQMFGYLNCCYSYLSSSINKELFWNYDTILICVSRTNNTNDARDIECRPLRSGGAPDSEIGSGGRSGLQEGERPGRERVRIRAQGRILRKRTARRRREVRGSPAPALSSDVPPGHRCRR